MTRARISEPFKAELVNVLKRAKGGQSRALMMKEDVQAQCFQGFVLEQEFTFLTVEEFISVFQVKPKDLGLSESKIPDVSGDLIKGIILREQKVGRKLRIFHTMQNSLHEWVHKHQHQLRAGQGYEAYQDAVAQTTKAYPKPLRATDTTPTMEELHKMVAARQQEAEEKKKQDAGHIPDPPQQHGDDEQRKQQQGEARPKSSGGLLEEALRKDDEDEVPDKPPTPVSFFGRAVAKQKPGKTGKGKGQSQAKATRATSAVAIVKDPVGNAGKKLGDSSSGDSCLIFPSDSASQIAEPAKKKLRCSVKLEGSTVSAGKGNKKAEALANCQKWRMHLDVVGVLSGNQMLNERYQTRRAKTKLEEVEPHHGEVHLAQGALDAMNLASSLQGNLDTLTKAEREELIDKLVRAEEFDWPACFQERLLAKAVKEHVEVGHVCVGIERERLERSAKRALDTALKRRPLTFEVILILLFRAAFSL